MYLLVDPSVKEKIKIVGFDETNVETQVFEAPNREILHCLDSFLHTKKMTKDDVQGIAVVVGVGGFTSTRIATTVANAWHFVNQILTLAVSAQEAVEPQKLIGKFSNQYVLAIYSGEPNIG